MTRYTPMKLAEDDKKNESEARKGWFGCEREGERKALVMEKWKGKGMSIELERKREGKDRNWDDNTKLYIQVLHRHYTNRGN